MGLRSLTPLKAPQQSGFSNTGCALYDGVNDFVTMGNVLDNDGTVPMTIMFWSKNASFDANEGADALSKLNWPTGTGYSVGFYNSGGSIYFNFFIMANFGLGDYMGLQTTGQWTANTWQQWIVTYDGSKTRAGMKCYKDGVLLTPSISAGNATMSGSSSTSTHLTLGTRSNDASGVWNYKGRMAQVATWLGTCLDSDEVTELSEGESVLDLNSFSKYPELTSWWEYATDLTPADSYNGTIYDRKSSYNGTPTNAASTFMDSESP